MKKCTQCGTEKPFGLFSTYKTKKGERKPKAACKACCVMANTARRNTPEGYKKLREYRTSSQGKQVAKKANSKFYNSEKHKKWHKENKGKYKAQVFARNASRKTIKNKCATCNSVKSLETHHKDYENPLDVIVLCSTCHGKLHTEINQKSTNSEDKED